MQFPMNRRSALGTLGLLGAVASAGSSRPAAAQDRLPPALPPGLVGPRPHGATGRMTGAQAAVETLRCECVPCVFGVPGAQNNEFWDAMKGAGLPYLLVTNEASASVMADGSARATGRRRRLQCGPRSGPDQRDDRDRRGAPGQRADRRDCHRRRPPPGCTQLPGPLDPECRLAPADLQGRLRGQASSADPIDDPRRLPDGSGRRARASGRGHPIQPLQSSLGLRRCGPPALPRPVRRRSLSPSPGRAVGSEGKGRDLCRDGMR